MPVLLKSSIKRTYAEALLNDIESGKNQYYMFIAKTSPWEATAGASADIVPVVSADTDGAEYDLMRRIIGYKKLDPSKIVFALNRVPWESGTIYDAYTDSEPLFDDDAPKAFYVVTSANNIYKCVATPLDSSVPSGIEPSHTSSAPSKYIEQGKDDGYTWKYLATVKASDLPYELVDYVPIDFVKTQATIVQAAASTDTEVTSQFNAQASAIDGEITRLEFVGGGGASAGYYWGSEYGARFVVGLTGATASSSNFGVGEAYTIGSSSTSNQFGLAVADIDKYVGHVLRVVGVSGAGTNASDVNKYGIILGVTASSNQYTFTVRGEYVPFSISSIITGSNYVYYDIVPYVKISGDGSGAYAFPVVGKTGETSYRRVTGVNLIGGGSRYSQARAEVASPRLTQNGSVNASMVAPIINTVLSPKGGHASNILKELNVKDIIMIVDLELSDEASIQTGGSYREFGIIKNPILNDGSGKVAGSDTVYYRDAVLLYTGSLALTKALAQSNFFPATTNNIITGTESFASFPVVDVPAEPTTTNGETRLQVTVKATEANPITYADRLDNYLLRLSPAVASSNSGFLVGETVTQYIPAGISAYGGLTFAYGITVSGTVLTATRSILGVRVQENYFARGSSSTVKITGSFSGCTAQVGGVSLAYGETVLVNKGLSLAAEGVTAELFRFIGLSPPYFTSSTVPSYSGLTVLNITKPTALSPLTDTTWENGAFVEQGKSGAYEYDYASGTVYKWSRTDTTKGYLYLTETFGSFKTSAVSGSTFSALNLSTTINGGYVVAGVSAPAIDPHSGEIVYISSIQPIQRLANQSEEFRLRLGF